MSTPENPSPAHPAPPSPPAVSAVESGIQREAMRLLARARLLREIQDARPRDPPPHLSDDELAKRLVYDLTTALVRSTVVLDEMVLPLLQEQTEELRRQNDLMEDSQAQTRIRLAQNAQQLSEDRERRSWIWRGVQKCVNGVAEWLGAIFSDTRVQGALSHGIASIIAMIFTIVTGYILLNWKELTDAGKNHPRDNVTEESSQSGDVTPE